jgi:peptide chain release factor subunit 3
MKRYLTGMVDKRTMEKYEREAKEIGRESWYLSWALDLNAEGTFLLLDPRY